LSFEKLGQGYGFILYRTILDDANVNGKNISIEGIHDRAYIQIGEVCTNLNVFSIKYQVIISLNLLTF